MGVDLFRPGRIRGEDLYGWIVHIENGVGDGYYLYVESLQDVLNGTI